VTQRPVEVFAVEPTSAQLIVRSPFDGIHEVGASDQELPVEVRDGIGSVVVDGLEPDASYPLRLDGEAAGTVRTLARPPGRLLGRLATVSDIHVGETGFGHLPRQHLSADFRRAHPVVALTAALRELTAWGAEGLLVKGDLTHDCRAGQFEIAGELLAASPGPVHVIPGNHDGGNHNHDDGAAVLARHGIALRLSTAAVDLAGLRVVSVNTMRPGHEHGYAPAEDDPVFELIGQGAPALVVLHHHLMTTRLPYFVPLGVPAGPARAFLDHLAVSNPDVWVTSGHTHRHRRRVHGPLVVTEVGSVKDHPGTWAGYLVYEGGLVQTVRRIADPTILAWTERTARSALGAWGRWSPGRLADRSVSHSWATARLGA
jgi:hypothetical protein